jgi:predicted dehydrogenase
MTKNVKFGILGCGMIASIHADAIKNIENATLVGVADNNVEFARKFASKHSVKAFDCYEQMLKSDIDVVCICTPSYFHAQNAIDALNSGKHVVVEKPMALCVADADRVDEASKRNNKLVTVISQLRFSDDVVRLKEYVESGAFGKISLCTLTMKYYRSKEYFASSNWKGTLKFDGGGALMNQGIHGVDLMQYIMGGVKNVSGKIGTLCHSVEVEDTAVATVEFNNGALGVIVASTCAYPGFDRKLEIHGEKGYAILTENNLEKLMIDGKDIELKAFKKSNTSFVSRGSVRH